MYEESRKIQLTRQDVVQKNTRDLLSRGIVIGIVGLFLAAMVGFMTWGLSGDWADQILLLQILAILMLIALWSAVALAMIGAGILLYQGFCMMQGKYTIEVDTVKLLELKSEKELRRSPLGRGYHTVLVTNQYVHFAKYGKVQSKLELYQGQECYLLVVLTKSPKILAIYQADKYLITER